MANDDLLTAAISDLPPKYDCDEETRENLRKIALSPRFIFINLDELRYINDSDYSFDFSGDEVQIQKILLYLFSCDFYAMYCDKFFRTIENGLEHRIFRPWHMHNNLPNNMVANYIRYVINTKNITGCDSLLSDEPRLGDHDYDPQLDYDPRFMPASTQYYILYSPFQEHPMYMTNRGYGYRDLCYEGTSGISPILPREGFLESEATRVFTCREAVVGRNIYHAVYHTWRIAVDEGSELVDRLMYTKLSEESGSDCPPATTYINPELPLPKCHTNNWWLDLHNFTLTVDDIRTSKESIASLVAADYIGAFLYTHKEKFNDYHALDDTAHSLMDDWMHNTEYQTNSMLYINADPQYYLDLVQKRRRVHRGRFVDDSMLLRYLVLRAYRRTITVKDMESYYLFLPAFLRKQFVNELFTLPVSDFNLFYPLVVDFCPSDGDDIDPKLICKMSFNKTSIRYHKSPRDSSQTNKINRTDAKNGNSPSLGIDSERCSDEPIQIASTCTVETSQRKTIEGKGEEASIILYIDTSFFAKHPCGFEEI